MARFNTQLQTIDVDVRGYERAVTASIEQQMNTAVREWIAEVTGRIPLWSGMTRGSLLKVADKVDGQIVLSPLKARSRIRKGRVLGKARINVGKAFASFTFESRVPQWQFQESSAGRSPAAPWRALASGSVFLQQAAENVTLPDPRPFFKVAGV